MLTEVLDLLDLKEGCLYIDGTLGGAGHSSEIIKKILPNGHLIGFDLDTEAIKSASEKLEPYKQNVTIVNENYCNIQSALTSLNIKEITGGVLLDLGASYHQLTKGDRGFSFSKDGDLDMRFSQSAEFTAYDVINSYNEAELVRIFSEYGEERYSKRIAKKIVEKRKKTPIKTTKELAGTVIEAIPNFPSKTHPATRIFQAIRIEVNKEFENIERAIKQVIPLLGPNATFVIISFHSLEDRLVKNLFKYYSSKCNCSKEQLICKCPPPSLEIITKKPIQASDEETKRNAPSRSAKVRAARKIN